MNNFKENKHISVLKKESVDSLDIKPGKIYVDLTLGAGGHSFEILSRAKNIVLVVLDIDKVSIESFKNRLVLEGFELKVNKYVHEPTKNIVYVANKNFVDIDLVLNDFGINKVNGILADLGWSLDQLDSIEGLSYEKLDNRLDMRFDKSKSLEAKHFLQFAKKDQLKEIFINYGDLDRNWKYLIQLVNFVLKNRNHTQYMFVKDLVNTINLIKFRSTEEKNNFTARVFQALRIAVNDELNNLEVMMNKALNILDSLGVLSAITFHSGEQKIVNKVVKNTKHKILLNTIRPSVDELKINLKARSAKLNIIKKLL